MTAEEKVEKLKELNVRLAGLLEKPELGLYTWVQAVGIHIEAMAKLVGLKYPI